MSRFGRMKPLFVLPPVLVSLVSCPSWGEIQQPLYLICHGIIQEGETAVAVRNETKTFILQQHERYGYPQYVLWSDIGVVKDCRYNLKEIKCGESPNTLVDAYSFTLDRVDGSVEEIILYRSDGPLVEKNALFSGQCKIKNKPEI